MMTTARRDWHAAVNAFVLLVLLGTFGEAFVAQSVAPSSSSSSRSTSERHRSSSRCHDPTGASSPNRGSTSSTGRSGSVSFLRATEGEAGDRALPSLTKHHAPPALSVPVFSLATVNEDGSTNMNIVTYASPVGIEPERLWMVSLFKSTLSYENFVREGWGVMQLLQRNHAPLVPILGQSGGRDTDKAGRCAEQAFPWDEPSCMNVAIIPGCGSYVTLHMVSKQSAGDHDAIICRIGNIFGPDEAASSRLEVLESGHLRKAGII
ncbi:conserved unknown protein [Ectocarpus siliculosus]|uniref:Flavin reductase like domain-containing protein n=1 Tax=Ectocarpus siliculosus TaxID=2880 RepID=D8LAS6_ECTSI|nr:conserved unknown protein [Ectocarpus siliculosus]|eukprot:CBN76435.1 conserved unknown protein [Ectocarpus siliculosus]